MNILAITDPRFWNAFYVVFAHCMCNLMILVMGYKSPGYNTLETMDAYLSMSRLKGMCIRY